MEHTYADAIALESRARVAIEAVRDLAARLAADAPTPKEIDFVLLASDVKFQPKRV